MPGTVDGGPETERSAEGVGGLSAHRNRRGGARSAQCVSGEAAVERGDYTSRRRDDDPGSAVGPEASSADALMPLVLVRRVAVGY